MDEQAREKPPTNLVTAQMLDYLSRGDQTKLMALLEPHVKKAANLVAIDYNDREDLVTNGVLKLVNWLVDKHAKDQPIIFNNGCVFEAVWNLYLDGVRTQNRQHGNERTYLRMCKVRTVQIEDEVVFRLWLQYVVEHLSAKDRSLLKRYIIKLREQDPNDLTETSMPLAATLRRQALAAWHEVRDESGKDQSTLHRARAELRSALSSFGVESSPGGERLR